MVQSCYWLAAPLAFNLGKRYVDIAAGMRYLPLGGTSRGHGEILGTGTKKG
jgi:hypothetical protein